MQRDMPFNSIEWIQEALQADSPEIMKSYILSIPLNGFPQGDDPGLKAHMKLSIPLNGFL